MILTYEQITAAANGIVRTEQHELGLELHRFTREQESFFYKIHPHFCHESFFIGYFGRNCRTCAGVRLDFISDAKLIKIKFCETAINQNPAEIFTLFDLYVDNEWACSYTMKDDIVYAASGEAHRFVLFLPAYAFPIISSVELEGATVYLPQKKEVDILFLGDSITHGASAVNPANSYVARIARKLDIGILNQGNSGFVYDAGSIEKVCDPKIIVTAYGINDFSRKNLTDLEQDTTDFLRKLKQVYGSATIVSILPLWTQWDGEDPNYKAVKKACLKSVYEKYSDYVIDGHDLVPHESKYFADAVHPNDEGFAFYADNLAKELQSLLAKL